MNRDIDAKIENIFSQMEDETLDESLGDWRLCGTENAKKSITSLIEAEVEKAKQSSYLDGLEAGIEMTMKRYNIPQTIINVREN